LINCCQWATGYSSFIYW